MCEQAYAIEAEWNEAARRWVASSSEIPGFKVEAESYDALLKEIKQQVPQLLESNLGVRGPGEVRVLVTTTREESVPLAA